MHCSQTIKNVHIEDTCVLRCDYHHLMKEVFPTKECFGINLMSIIDKDLRKMLLSSKEEEWITSYLSIADKIQEYPAKMTKLDKIREFHNIMLVFTSRRYVDTLK